jgi:hypothetical protein
MGVVTGSGVFWVVELKKDLHAPLISVQQVLLIQVHSETRRETEGEEDD